MTFSDLIGTIGVFGLAAAFVFGCVTILFGLYHFISRDIRMINLIEMMSQFQLGSLVTAMIMLAILLQKNAFEFTVVFDAVENGMPWFYKVGGLWSGQSNSLLFWSTLMSAGVLAANSVARKMDRPEMIPGISIMFQFILLFFIVPIVFFTNPFTKLWSVAGVGFVESILPPAGSSLIVPVDGLGMNPSLRHPAMLLHPPFLYMGLIGFFVPYVINVMTLLYKDCMTNWIQLTFPIAVGAWVCLTIGMLLGSWWAYTILGWGGYWGWDAVEISGLLPWILSFGLIHSMQMQMLGGNYRKWVHIFIAAIIILILFGILLTRSGLIESVHAYSSGTMGPMLTVLTVINLVIMLVLITSRWQWLSTCRPRPKFQYLDHLALAFNFNTILLVAFYLFGQTLPVTSRLFFETPVLFTPQQYEMYSAPLLISLIVITGLFAIAPIKMLDEWKYKRTLNITLLISLLVPTILLFRWQLSFLNFLGFWACAWLLMTWVYVIFADIFWPLLNKSRRSVLSPHRLPSMVIHLGFAVMVMGIMGVENLTSQADIQIGIMDNVSIDRYVLNSYAIRQITQSTNQTNYELDIRVDENGKLFSLIPIIEYFPKREMLHPLPAQHSSIFRDFQLVMTRLPEPPGNQVTLRLFVFPLMMWIWVGGGLMALGGLLQLISLKKRQA